jgi:hypothetical protein
LIRLLIQIVAKFLSFKVTKDGLKLVFDDVDHIAREGDARRFADVAVVCIRA